MGGRNVSMYFTWSYPDETGLNLGDLTHRFAALFELRRVHWPRFERLADPERFDQGIGGFLDHVLRVNYDGFIEYAGQLTGNQVRTFERKTSKGASTLLTDAIASPTDTVIIVSFDSQRAVQLPNAGEISGLRSFLQDPDHTAFVCPHHDIGNVEELVGAERLRTQEAEYLHHGDRGIPPAQHFGGYARALLEGLGTPVINRFGLNPAKNQDGSPVPLEIDAAADRFKLLEGVGTFNLHSHLPHLVMPKNGRESFDVLARQSIDLTVPSHPFVEAGNKQFTSLLQSKPGVFDGKLLVCDATIWSSTNGGLEGLQRFWRNVLTQPRVGLRD